MLRFIVTCLPTAALWVLFHCARHSYAVMAISNGMPIESVSKVLGHTKITTTQHYAKITMEKLDEDFSMLESKLGNSMTLA